jgi:hypothetical protein
MSSSPASRTSSDVSRDRDRRLKSGEASNIDRGLPGAIESQAAVAFQAVNFEREGRMVGLHAIDGGLSRKDFLRGLGAAGLGGAVLGSGALLRPAAAAASMPQLGPMDLSFSTTAQYRPFEIVASGFAAVDDSFRGRTGSYAILAPAPERHAGAIGVARGALTVSGRSYFALLAAAAGPAAPYAAVQVDVASFSERHSTTQDSVYAGLVAGAADYVVAAYDRATQTVTVEVVTGGRRQELAQASVALRAPFAFAFVLNENNVIALADSGAGFRPLLRANVAAVLDLRDPSVLSRYRYAFGARADSGTTALERVQAGYWGKAGVRDPHVVTWADGTPFIADGRVYLTLTNAGLGFFEFAHWGVYTLDLAQPRALKQVGKIFWQRDGHVVGDHAGHIVYDDAIGAFRLLVSNWGTFSGNGVLVNSAVVHGDVLHGVTVVRDPTVLPLPTDVSRWDPHMVRIDGRWYVAFVESPSQNPFTFHPALARGPRSGEFGSFTLAGRDAARTMTEGMVMQKIGGTWYVLCSSSRDEGPDGGHYRVYDLDMRFLGFLNAPYPTNIPHPMVFPVPIPETRSTRYEMVTFDGTQYYEDVLGYGTHGDFYVMEAAQVARGYEFPPRRPPTLGAPLEAVARTEPGAPVMS